jgi:hypothetical protein
MFLLRLLVALLLIASPLPVRAEDGVGAAGDPIAPCTQHGSLTTPPETIRVLRNRTGRVEIVPFRLYTYRTHTAEFWTEYRTSPYSDALLGAGAVAIKQNAWLWTMNPRNWWGLSATSTEERSWVEADYADDNQLNGSSGNPAKGRQGRADQNAATALRMRIRFGADRVDNGIGGLVYEASSATYTAPLVIRDDAGNLLPVNAETPRSCFDVIDHPSMNQFYATGGLYEPGYVNESSNNARYNRAVDATWGLTIRRAYAPDEFRMWRPGFYGSFNSDKRCLLRPSPGDTLPMRHVSQPSHWRGWSFFPENADTCAKERGWTTEELLRQSFFSWEGEGSGSGNWTLSAVTPIRLVSPATDLTGDGRGDLLATNAAGSLAIVSADPAVDAAGRYKGAFTGRLPLATGETLVERLLTRTADGGALAVTDLRRSVDGSFTVLEAAFAGGTLDAPAIVYGPVLRDPTVSASLHAADLDGDGLDERLLAERAPATEPDWGLPTLTISALVAGAEPAPIATTPAAAGSRLLIADLTGDRVADALLLTRLTEGTLTGSLAAGQLTDGVWSLGEFSTPGALLFPIPERWSVTAADATGDGAAALHLVYRDPAARLRIVRIALSADAVSGTASPDLVLGAPTPPATSTTARSGETTLAAIAARTGIELATLVALNDTPYRTATIRPGDSYATVARRAQRSDACLRTMNANKALVAGKTLRIPLDACRLTAASKLRLDTPVRLYPPQLDWLRDGDTIDSIIARAAAMGVPLTTEALAALNPTLDLATAPVNTRLRIRTPWTPPVRSVEPAAPITAGGRTLAWTSPAPLWRGGDGGPTHRLLAIEWTGDGIVDLLLAAPASRGGTTLYRLAPRDGLLAVVETISRPGLVAGWTLR